MYKGFNLVLNDDTFDKLIGSLDDFSEKMEGTGAESNEFIKGSIKDNIYKTLDKLVENDNSIDTSNLMSDWFPQVKADIFISHSHKDKSIAVKLSNWLYINFGLRSFIDSSVWGYANELLQEIDNKYCYNDESRTYDYKLRNYTTNHVYLMLANSLTTMIDRTECLFFINTSESISVSNTVEEKTNSPWLFHELNTSQIIRKKSPERKIILHEGTFAKEERGLPSFEYDAELNHLEFLSTDDLLNWYQDYRTKKMFGQHLSRDSIHSLDVLYKMKSNN